MGRKTRSKTNSRRSKRFLSSLSQSRPCSLRHRPSEQARRSQRRDSRRANRWPPPHGVHRDFKPGSPSSVSSVCVYLRDITPYEHIKLKYSLSPMNPVTYIQHGHTYPLSGLPPAPLLASLQTSHFRPDQNPKGLCPESRG